MIVVVQSLRRKLMSNSEHLSAEMMIYFFTNQPHSIASSAWSQGQSHPQTNKYISHDYDMKSITY